MCLLHPEEPIIRVCVNAKCKSNSVSCAECAFSQSSKQCLEHKEDLLTLQKFVNHVSTFHTNSDSTTLLEPLQTQILKEKEFMLDAKQKIENAKKDVKNTITQLIANITKQLSTLETKISNELDQQLESINQGFKACKTLLDSHSLEKESDKNAKLLVSFQYIDDSKELANFVTIMRTELAKQREKYVPTNLKSESSKINESLQKSLQGIVTCKNNAVQSLQAKADQITKFISGNDIKIQLVSVATPQVQPTPQPQPTPQVQPPKNTLDLIFLDDDFLHETYSANLSNMASQFGMDLVLKKGIEAFNTSRRTLLVRHVGNNLVNDALEKKLVSYCKNFKKASMLFLAPARVEASMRDQVISESNYTLIITSGVYVKMGDPIKLKDTSKTLIGAIATAVTVQ
jgi:hypothetical protein